MNPRVLPFAEVNERLSGAAVADLVGLEPARERHKHACPSCDSSDGCHAYPEPGSGAYCFACGTSFSAVDLAMAVWGLSAADACRRLSDLTGIRAPSDPSPVIPPRRAAREEDRASVRCDRQEVYGTMVAASELGPLARTYLEGRGLNPDFAAVQGFRSVESPRAWRDLRRHLLDRCGADRVEAAGFGSQERRWWPWGGQVPGILLPYFTRPGNAVDAVRFRRLTPGTRRYMAPLGAGASIPWRAEAFEAPAPLEIVVTEGELDALTLLQAGYEAVALGGATPSRQVVGWVVEASEPVDKMALWTDADDAGEGAVNRLVAALVERYGVSWVRRRVVRWRSRKDANDLARSGGLA